MEKETLSQVLSIVNEARTLIYIASRCKDGRKREKQIREAKVKAQEMVKQVEPEIRMLCQLDDNNGMDDLFAWGFLESDLDKVYSILLKIKKQLMGNKKPCGLNLRRFVKFSQIIGIAMSALAILIILWFDCTHRLWVFSECVNFQKVINESFSLRNIDHWFLYAVPILLANLGVYFRLKSFGRWYDFIYLFRCLFGIFMSAVVLTIEIPWDGVIHTFENEHPYEFLYLYSLLLLIFLLLPSDLILFSIGIYKRMRKPND